MALIEPIPEATFKPWIEPDMFVMIAPADHAGRFREEAEQQCGARKYCRILGWTSASEAPSGLPMTYRQVKAQAFDYVHNRLTGHELALWDCERFPRPAKNECLGKVYPPPSPHKQRKSN